MAATVLRNVGGGVRPRTQRIKLASAGLLLVVGALAVIGASAATGQGGWTRIGASPKLARGALELGETPAATAISGAVLLRPRDAAALKAFIAQVTDRGSTSYGHYLAQGQFAARFGAAPATIAAVRKDLEAHGVHPEVGIGDGLEVRFSGTAAHLAGAFGTGLERYRLPNGRIARATTSAPALPSSIAGSVSSVEGLDDLAAALPLRSPRRGNRPSSIAAAGTAKFAHSPGAPDACSAARKAALEFGGLTDDEIGNAYGASGLYALGDTGAGVHVGIFEQESFLPADIEHFDKCYFGSSAASKMAKRLDVISLEGGIPQGPGSYGEALLDVEDVAAMAPGANIDVYESPETPGGEVTQIAAMVEEDRDQFVTNSYGQPCEEEEEDGQPGTQQTLNFLFEQAAAQGQTFINAAGDSGSDTCEEVHREHAPLKGQNPISEGEIASQPYVLGVGGTTITDAAQPVHESVWNNGAEGGAGGGGISQSFAMPSWQRDSTVPGIDLPGSADYLNGASVEQRYGYPTGFCDDNLTGAEADAPCRLEPDVSADANWWTGAITVYSEEYKGELGEEESPDGWVTSGGTSSASPIWAGMLALADASPTCRNNSSTASGVGFVSPLLYEIASNPSAYAASFNDVTEGNNDIYGLDDGKVFPARTGYDLGSGLGSPRMSGPGGTPGLAFYLCSYAASSGRPAVTSLSPTSGTTAGGETVTVKGSGYESAGVPDVSAVQVGTWHVPSNDMHVLSATALSITLPPARDTLAPKSPAPQDGAGNVEVIVTTTGDESSATGPASTFEYVDTSGGAAIPGVSGVVPFGGDESAPEPVSVFGSGFTAVKEVTFGGVRATSYTVLSDSTISVTPPAYSAQTQCAPLPSGGAYAGDTATNDICQVQVVVHGASGASATGAILPPFEGSPTFEADGALLAPAGCDCEGYPVPSEFDYAPSPTVTSISTSDGPSSLASEAGGTLITVRGRGLSRTTLDYVNFEEPGLEEFTELDSLNAEIAFVNGTEMQLMAPPLEETETPITVTPKSVPFAVHSLAGESAPMPIEYAGIPSVSSVRTADSSVRLEGVSGASDNGGTPIELTGKGMLGQVSYVSFTNSAGSSSEGTNYTVEATSKSRLTSETVSQQPTLANVQACTATGCSAISKSDLLYLYSPGQPTVEAIAPRSGSSAGGTKVTVRGENLGCPLAVSFGGVAAESFKASEALLTCRAATALEAVSPAGTVGAKVPVTVTTEESYFSGTGDAPNPAQFTYTKP